MADPPRTPGQTPVRAGGGLTSVSAPSPLRLAGFLATVLGALGLGVGAVLTWVTVPEPGGIGGSNLSVVYKGLDLTAGKVAIGAALVLLVGLMALRGARSRTAEKVIAAVILLAALAGLAAATLIVFSADSRYGLSDRTGVTLGAGLFIAVAGGAIGVVGGVLDLAWAAAPVAESAPEPVADDI